MSQLQSGQQAWQGVDMRAHGVDMRAHGVCKDPEILATWFLKIQSVVILFLLYGNIDWFDKTAEFHWNYRGKVDKLKFGL